VFWVWLLKYSSFLITGVVSVFVGILVHKLTTRYADLIFYTSRQQWVVIPPQQTNNQQVPPIGTFSLFLWNNGKAPAREVHVGHFFIPAHNVFPDLPRETTQTPGGGSTIRFPVIPPRTLVTISYLIFGTHPVEQIISYVGWEEGRAKRITVMLQRVWPKWFMTLLTGLLIAGAWVAVNAIFSLVKILWITYYLK